jgi:signal transduction histidine kinase
MDAEPRGGLNKEESRVLGWLAGLVITHLEINREAMEGRRSKLMSDALNVFVDGRSKLKVISNDASRPSSVHLDVTSGDRTPSKRTSWPASNDKNLDGALHTQDRTDVSQGYHPPDIEQSSEQVSENTKDRTATSSDRSSDEENFGGTTQDEAISESHRFTFSRAANILRECFEMDGGDGVLFLEAGTGLTYSTGDGLAVGKSLEAQDEKSTHDTTDETPTPPTHQVGTNTLFDPLNSAFTKHSKNSAPVLAYSTKHEPFLRGPYPGGHAALGEINQDVLRELFKRYPQGKIWVLEDGVMASSSSEDDQRGKENQGTSPQRRRRAQERGGEASMMARLFPEVRQILFVPLWDAVSSCWSSGCFIWSRSETRIFSAAIDLGFLSAFGKTIMAECSRLDTLLADKQKADFIGSISHELRSPLHGILAGAEFLSETATSAFQRSLVDTVEACGRTLLDTINHVLDFSKINSLDQNWRNNRQPRRRLTEGQIGRGAQMSSKQLPSGAPPLLRLYAVTDIAAITEEVVEASSVGQIYSQASDLTDISAGNRGRGADKGMRVPPRTVGGRDDGKQSARDAIEVILDIAKEDWTFMAQPGAIRRIIMNLFGKWVPYSIVHH